jgi:hypothetical protein
MSHAADRFPLPRHWPARVKSGLVTAIGLAHLGMTYVRGWCANSPLERVRLAGDLDRAKTEVALLREIMRIKDARMAAIAAPERPHYAPTDRLAILQIRAAQRWTSAETARVFLVTAQTIAEWMRRIDEDGPDALVRVPAPVNRFPELVTYLVQRLKTMCPAMGKERIANLLTRAGLPLSVSTVRRMLKAKVRGRPPPQPPRDDPNVNADPAGSAGRTVTAKYPDHV